MLLTIVLVLMYVFGFVWMISVSYPFGRRRYELNEIDTFRNNILFIIKDKEAHASALLSIFWPVSISIAGIIVVFSFIITRVFKC